MSGHSKWSTIKRQKGAADAKRGQVFTKLASAITIAVKQGGGISDPAQNFKLRLLIEKARAANMPKDNIERAIERGKGKAGGEAFDEVVYEGFGPGGVALIVEAVTDKKLRTTAEVKSLLEKNGATMGNPGAVSYQFQTKGEISVKKAGKSLDDVFLIAADAGAEDVEDAGEEAIIYTKPEELAKVKDALEQQGCTVLAYELVRKPVTKVAVENVEHVKKFFALVEKIEAHDDVQKVYSNIDIPDTMLQQLT